MSKKKITDIEIGEQTARTTSVQAVFNYAGFPPRHVNILIPYTDEGNIAKELRQAHKEKKPKDGTIEFPKEMDWVE